MFLLRCVKRFSAFWTKALDFLLIFFGKGVKDVAVVYATLIVKGMKTFAQVPDRLKEQVREILIALDCPEMAE